MNDLGNFRIFVGYDSREPQAWHVCVHSIMRRASLPVSVEPVMLSQLHSHFCRDDPKASTEFSVSRFLTPWLAGYSGVALFVDCDFLFLEDPWHLYEHAKSDPHADVFCVKHDYTPRSTEKMDGQAQYAYPRKNWSSLMVFNCHRQRVRALTPEYVSKASPADLHRFAWSHDANIAELPPEWNWLVGEYPWRPAAEIHALHYTLGGPWFPNYAKCDYAELWMAERDRMLGYAN